ncbi:MAG: hypothetical protein GX900_05320, partial [Clostridiaceae bacterium]|nr:hypothetical protein [Clostridiaceae bacterium]
MLQFIYVQSLHLQWSPDDARRDVFLLYDDYFLWLAADDQILSETSIFPNQENTALPHDHIMFNIHIPTEGKYYLQTMQGHYLIETGSMLIVPPHIYHVAKRIDNDTSPIRRSCFNLEVRRINSHLPDLSPVSSSASTVFSIYTRLKQPTAIKDDFSGLDAVRQLSRVMQEGQVGYYQKAQAILLFLVTEIAVRLHRQLDKFPDSEPSTEFDLPNHANVLSLLRKERIERCVTRYTLSVITLEQIAKDLFVSPRQLSRIFTELYGKNYTEFIIEKRMEFAKFALVCS